MFKKKPTEQRFEFINQEIKFSEKRNSSVVCVVPIPKHLELWDTEYGYLKLIDPATFRTWKKHSSKPLIEVSIECTRKCSSLNELREYLDDGKKKYFESESPFIGEPESIHLYYDIRTSCERNEIISKKGLWISKSYNDDLVSYYDSYDYSSQGSIDITFYSYTLIRGNMFRFSLNISKEILSKKHLNLRRDKHEVRTSEGWLHSYVDLFRQKNGVYVYP